MGGWGVNVDVDVDVEVDGPMFVLIMEAVCSGRGYASSRNATASSSMAPSRSCSLYAGTTTDMNTSGGSMLGSPSSSSSSCSSCSSSSSCLFFSSIFRCRFSSSIFRRRIFSSIIPCRRLLLAASRLSHAATYSSCQHGSRLGPTTSPSSSTVKYVYSSGRGRRGLGAAR